MARHRTNFIDISRTGEDGEFLQCGAWREPPSYLEYAAAFPKCVSPEWLTQLVQSGVTRDQILERVEYAVLAKQVAVMEACYEPGRDSVHVPTNPKRDTNLSEAVADLRRRHADLRKAISRGERCAHVKWPQEKEATTGAPPIDYAALDARLRAGSYQQVQPGWPTPGRTPLEERWRPSTERTTIDVPWFWSQLSTRFWKLSRWGVLRSVLVMIEIGARVIEREWPWRTNPAQPLPGLPRFTDAPTPEQLGDNPAAAAIQAAAAARLAMEGLVEDYTGHLGDRLIDPIIRNRVGIPPDYLQQWIRETTTLIELPVGAGTAYAAKELLNHLGEYIRFPEERRSNHRLLMACTGVALDLVRLAQLTPHGPEWYQLQASDDADGRWVLYRLLMVWWPQVMRALPVRDIREVQARVTGAPPYREVQARLATPTRRTIDPTQPEPGRTDEDPAWPAPTSFEDLHLLMTRKLKWVQAGVCALEAMRLALPIWDRMLEVDDLGHEKTNSVIRDTIEEVGRFIRQWSYEPLFTDLINRTVNARELLETRLLAEQPNTVGARLLTGAIMLARAANAAARMGEQIRGWLFWRPGDNSRMRMADAYSDYVLDVTRYAIDARVMGALLAPGQPDPRARFMQEWWAACRRRLAFRGAPGANLIGFRQDAPPPGLRLLADKG